ncbi:uncharacterized protein LOC662398 isoform X2 [Tribolium castaneum]|uniref:uncharacterized protein LOC662398 isoform X2 n=1 Tax=Tribolium castaneum TaxID=7070 RepID=UPI0030FE6F16
MCSAISVPDGDTGTGPIPFDSPGKILRGIFPLGWGIGLVRFENSVCGGADGFEGTCYTRRQCNEIGGVGAGPCAKGIGVCCIIQITCGGSSSYNNTYFTSPNFPTPYPGGSTCTVTIPKCNPDICQIRIDFLAFSLAQPDANGTCTTDAFYVIGGASNVPVLCGENSGQHIYVDFNGDSDIQLVLNTNAAATAASRAWNFKITQIGCDCPTKAPTGCLQYYTALSGTVRSFNYGTTGPQTGTRQLANENYGVCVEMQPGYCSITWGTSPGDMYAFTVTGNTNQAVGNGTIGPPSALSNGNCTTDFVVIPNPSYVNSSLVGPNTDRFCGNGFNSVTTSSKPFVLTVVTDGTDIPPTDEANRGFSLMYTQNQCSGTGNLFGK